MRAIKLAKPGGLDNLTLSEIDARPPGPGEIQVKVEASSLNFPSAKTFRPLKRATLCSAVSSRTGRTESRS